MAFSRRWKPAWIGVSVLLVLSVGFVETARAADTSIDAVVESDPAVLQAREELEAAQRQRDALNASLDQAAAEFEEARGLAERLATEADEVDRELASREATSDALRQETRERVISGYLSPSRQMSLSEFVLAADDAATAMHVMSLIGHMGGRGDATISQLDRTDELGRDVVRQQHVVTAGAETAAKERLVAAGRLQALLDEATHVVSTADATLAKAATAAEERERERRRREAERARREAERLAREEAERLARERQAHRATASAPLPDVDGRVCPIGAPNGFIDSWGFPRSGGRSHKGVDIFAAYGTPLFAVADGTADVRSNRLGGLTVWITDDRGDRYYYAHLASVAVADGARVRVGEVVGATGTSGNAAGTPPHLHWEYHPGGGAAVNPYPLAAALCR